MSAAVSVIGIICKYHCRAQNCNFSKIGTIFEKIDINLTGIAYGNSGHLTKLLGENDLLKTGTSVENVISDIGKSRS